MIDLKDKYSTILLTLSAFVIAAVFVLALKNRGEVKMEDAMQVGNYTAICIDGVQYWRAGSSLAIRIDKETLTPKRCEVAGKVDATPVCKNGVLYDSTGKALPSLRPCED